MSTQKQPSLQSILKRRQQEEFIGREEHIFLFCQNLTYGLEDERRRFIFSVSGQGGVGKTTLLHLFSKLATEANAKVAWVDETIEDMPAAMAHMAKQLEGQDHIFNTFNERYRSYLQRLHELEADPEAPQGSLAFISQALTKVGVSLGRRIPVAGGAFDLVDEKALASQVGAWSEYVKKKLTNKDELHLIQKPLDVLTPLFLEGLRNEAEKHSVVLILDTYERTGEYLDGWLRRLLDGSYGDVPSNIIVVIAGRNELDKNRWILYEGLLVRFELEPFTEQEARAYLAHKGITEERTVEVVLHLSGRFPLLVATLASESPTNPDQVGDPSGTAIERFLKWEDDPKRKQLLIDAALPHYLNQDIIAVIMGDKNADSFFAWLKQKPFLEQRGKGWVYHEIVRPQMLRYKLHESPQSWSDLHGKLADYFEQLCKRLYSNNEIGQIDPSLKTYQLEAFYHHICQSTPREIIPIMGRYIIERGEYLKKDDESSFSEESRMIEQAMNDLGISKKLEDELGKEMDLLIHKLKRQMEQSKDYINKFTPLEIIPEKRELINEMNSVLNRMKSTVKALGFDIMPEWQKIFQALERKIKDAEIISNFDNKADREQATVIDTSGQKARKRKLPSRSKSHLMQTE